MKSKKTTKSATKLSSLDEISQKTNPSTGLSFLYKIVLIVILGVVSYKLAYKYRGQFLAGVVNKTPITRFELNKAMAERYGESTFEDLVVEKLIDTEIKNNSIIVDDTEVNSEIDKIKAQYGSEENFAAVLKQYNTTLDKAKESIKRSLAIKKLIEKNEKIEITDQEINDYFTTNKQMYEGKKVEDVKSEIENTLYQQYLYQKSQDLFTRIRQEASVSSFLQMQ